MWPSCRDTGRCPPLARNGRPIRSWPMTSCHTRDYRREIGTLRSDSNVADMEQILDMNPAGARILMVDDDPGIRDVVSDFLGKHGYKVDTAGDATEMEAALERGPVDLIVLDVMLPGEDGLAICRRFANGEGGPPIIMLSAMGEDTDRIVGLELGADDYLAKPCNPRELLARVRAVLRRAEQRSTAGGVGAGCEFAGWRLDLVRRELRSPP